MHGRTGDTNSGFTPAQTPIHSAIWKPSSPAKPTCWATISTPIRSSRPSICRSIPAIPEERKYFGMYAMSSVPEGRRGLPDGHIPLVREKRIQERLPDRRRRKEFRLRIEPRTRPAGAGRGGHANASSPSSTPAFFSATASTAGISSPLESVERLVDKIRTGDELEVRSRRRTWSSIKRRVVRAAAHRRCAPDPAGGRLSSMPNQSNGRLDSSSILLARPVFGSGNRQS